MKQVRSSFTAEKFCEHKPLDSMVAEVSMVGMQ